MKKGSKLFIRDFKKLSYEEQVRTLSTISKRANSRISSLEDSGLTGKSKAYRSLATDRFYQGKKYHSQEDVLNQFKKVSSFLNDESSTITGAKKSRVSPTRTFDSYEMPDLRNLTAFDKVEMSQRWSKTANARLSNLEQHGVDYYAYENAQAYLKLNGRQRFYQGKNFESERQLNQHLRELSYFLTSKSSTMKGLKSIRKNRVDTFNKMFKEKGFDFQIDNDNEKSFFDFLSSKQFTKGLSKWVDSNQIIDDFAQAMAQGYSVNEIYSQYKDFLQNHTKMTFEQINEKRQGKKKMK